MRRCRTTAKPCKPPISFPNLIPGLNKMRRCRATAKPCKPPISFPKPYPGVNKARRCRTTAKPCNPLQKRNYMYVHIFIYSFFYHLLQFLRIYSIIENVVNKILIFQFFRRITPYEKIPMLISLIVTAINNVLRMQYNFSAKKR